MKVKSKFNGVGLALAHLLFFGCRENIEIQNAFFSNGIIFTDQNFNSESSTCQDSLFSYLALGDSYTIGAGVSPEERWPRQLSEKLDSAGQEVDELSIIATSGWTTTNLLEALKTRELHDHYDLVSLLIGVNNQYRGYDIRIYESEFKILLRKSIRFAGGEPSKVFVLSIPDWGVTPFARGRDPIQIGREIDLYNRIASDICSKENVAFYDITGISRLAASQKELLVADSLHPSGLMYRMWVESVLENIVATIKIPE